MKSKTQKTKKFDLKKNQINGVLESLRGIRKHLETKRHAGWEFIVRCRVKCRLALERDALLDATKSA